MKKQQEIANKIFSKIELIDSTAIIAGGAPRDWYFGNLASDIDIFYYYCPELAEAYHLDTFERLGLKNIEILPFLSEQLENEDLKETYTRNYGTRRL